MADHDVIIIGAGFGGMGAAISLKRLGYEDISILEREDDLGGTWHVNHYPGLAVDIASVTYSYSFEPNPHWKHWFARGAELKRYAAHVAEKYDLRRHMEFGVLAEGARWDEDEQHWVLTTRGVAKGSRRKIRTARYLMTATGFLSQPRLPDIDGVEDFAGTVIHTAKWDDSVDLDGKRIAVIGTGATAVQLIPKVARRAGHLTVFQRTPIWVTPKTDFKIPGAVQRVFASQPWTQRAARRVNSAWLEGMMVTAVLHYKQARFLNQGAAALAKAHLRRQVKDPETRAKLTPDYSFGCKRPTFSNEYYPTFNRPDVTLETSPISRITPTGIITRDPAGSPVEHEVDVLVLATGFNLWDTNFPAIEVIGRDGKDLGKSWRTSGYHAFEGVTVSGFPNFISLNSPYSYSGLSYFMTIEVQMRHIERLFGALRERCAETFEVTAKADAEFLDHMLERMDDTVFNQGSCGTARSYYYTNEGDAVLLRPTSSGSARRAVENFSLSDYAFA